jgi:hypothetical protein
MSLDTPVLPENIEITPEMIYAGAEAIAERYGGLDLDPSPSVVAREVFLAMHVAAPLRGLSKRSE